MKQYTRYIIAIVCICIIILRVIFPKINFDYISLILLGFSGLIIIIPNPKQLAERVTKFKIGSFEIELEKLNKETEKIEEKFHEQRAKYKGISGIPKQDDNFKAKILGISSEIEEILQSIYDFVFKTTDEKHLSFEKLIFTLKEKNVLDGDTANWLLRFEHLEMK